MFIYFFVQGQSELWPISVRNPKSTRYPNMPQPFHVSYKFLSALAIVLLSLLIAPLVAQKPERAIPLKAVQQSKQAANLFELAMAKPGERIPKALLSKVVAVAVINNMKTVGLIFEGAGDGRGVVTRRFANGKWSPPAYIRMAAFSIGPQFNARSFSVILLFMNDKSADWLLDKKAVVFDRARAPVAGPVGEIKTEEKEVVPVADVFSYVFDDDRLQSKDLKNLLKNVAISFDNNLNKETYGVKAAEILSDAEGQKLARVPAEVKPFSDTVARLCAAE